MTYAKDFSRMLESLLVAGIGWEQPAPTVMVRPGQDKGLIADPVVLLARIDLLISSLTNLRVSLVRLMSCTPATTNSASMSPTSEQDPAATIFETCVRKDELNQEHVPVCREHASLRSRL